MTRKATVKARTKKSADTPTYRTISIQQGSELDGIIELLSTSQGTYGITGRDLLFAVCESIIKGATKLTNQLKP